MNSPFTRYAIYWVPEPQSALAAFGEKWFAQADEDAPENISGLPPGLIKRATKSPARYGLHATLKAPFRLREDMTVEALQKSLDAFCAIRRRVRGGGLRLAKFQGYLGLVLKDRTAEADWLAAQCVTLFGHFRAPLSAEDREKRPSNMPPLEAAYFEAFGYPYVLSEFEFHLSLAGPLRAGDIEEVESVLQPLLTDEMLKPITLESIALLGEEKDGGQFQLLSRHYFRS